MKLKLVNTKKAIAGLIICGGFLLHFNSNAFASDDVSLTDESIIRNFGGSGEDLFYSVTETSDGGFVAVGESSSTNAGFTNRGLYDAMIVKYNKYGDQQWAKNYGGYSNEFFHSVIETSDKGFLAVGYSKSPDAWFSSNGGSDGVIVKYNSLGDQLWVRNFGGSNEDYFYSAVETSDKGFIVAGISYSSDAGFMHKGYADSVLVKYNSNGQQQWVKSFGGSGDDIFRAISKTTDGGFVAAGYSTSYDLGYTNKGYEEMLIVKYNANGDQQWMRTVNGNRQDLFRSVVGTSDGGVIAVGYSDSTDLGTANRGGSDGIIVKYNSQGKQEWIRSFGGLGTEYFYSVIEVLNDRFVVVGQSSSGDAGFVNRGDTDAVVVVYDSQGNQKLVKGVGGSGTDYFYSVAKTSDNGFVAAGTGSSRDAEFNNNGGTDAIVAKYTFKVEDEGLKEAEEAVSKAEQIESRSDVEEARNLVNQLPESIKKDQLQDRLNQIFLDLPKVSLKTATSKADIYIIPTNTLSVSLDTNMVTFNNFSGTEDVEMLNAIGLTVSSTQTYKIGATLDGHGIENADKTNTMDKSILHIKSSDSTLYNTFKYMTSKTVLLSDNQPTGVNIRHGIDLKLKGNIAHEKDVYKALLHFTVEQK